MAKIIMNETAAGPDGVYEEGEEYRENEVVKQFVEDGFAEYVETPENNREDNIETAENQNIDEDVYPKHTGGGWYELSNGEKVRGKEEAIKAEKELE